MILPQGPGSTMTCWAHRLPAHFGTARQAAGRRQPAGRRARSHGNRIRAAPDGYTLVGVAASMLTITPHIYSKLAYDPLRDFTPVGYIVLAQTAICVNKTCRPDQCGLHRSR